MITWNRLRAHRGFVAGALLAGVVVVLALAGPALVADPDATDYAAQLLAPSSQHRLGTDAAGRDVFARTVVATRTSLFDALLVAALTALLGVTVGGLAGFLRGPVDAVLSRLIDVMQGLPQLVIALAVVGALGVGHLNLLLALVITGWAYTARVTRALALGSHSRLDVAAARLAGVPSWRIVRDHVLPGAMSQVMVVSATGFGSVVLSLAGLSFLGLGAQPPTAELGQMLEDSRGDLAIAPWLAIGPTVVIATLVGAAVLLSEALRDVLAVGSTASLGSRRASRTPRTPGPSAAGPDGALPLRLRDLHVTYPDGTVAVRGVDLDIGPGECLAVIGESGSGKTSLTRALLRLTPPGTVVTGEVVVGGPARAPSQERPGLRTGLVAQDPYATFDPLRSVGDHVRSAWRYHRRPVPDDVAERVGRLGVADAGVRLRARPATWSGGMLQRASAAAATAHSPTLLVADEPTSALDAELADQVLATLREASSAMLLISHDLRLVARHADRIAVMRAGRIVETGPARDVVERPSHPYTQALLAASGEA